MNTNSLGEALRSFEAGGANRSGLVKRFTITAVALLMLAGAPVASAVTFGFDLVFTTGPLSGQTFGGTIETTPGDGIKTPANGGLLDLSTVVDGEPFDETDDVGFPIFPEVEVAVMGSQIVFVDYIGVNANGAELGIVFDLFGGDNEVYLIPTVGSLSFGVFVPSNVPAVPEPVSSWVVLAIGVFACGMGLSARGRMGSVR